jgi:hypothetical protein
MASDNLFSEQQILSRVYNDTTQTLATSSSSAGGSASPTSTTATTTGTASSITSVALKALNANRKSLSVFNNSTANLYIKEGTAASIASAGFGVKVVPGALYELPAPVYTGAINGIWDAVDGYANVVERT